MDCDRKRAISHLFGIVKILLIYMEKKIVKLSTIHSSTIIAEDIQLSNQTAQNDLVVTKVSF